MKGRAILKALTPFGWVVVSAVLLAGVASLSGGFGFRWDPFGLQQRRLVAAETRAALGEGEAQARRVEAQGAAEQLRRFDDFQQQQAAATQKTATAVAKARSADDADMLLEDRRADRLRGHDRELCRLAPDLDGCAATTGLAGSGEPSVRPGGPAA